MSIRPTKLRSQAGNVWLELALTLPILMVLGLGVVEFGKALRYTLVLTHLTREAGSIVSRQPGTKGSVSWANGLNSDLIAVIDSATPVINRLGTGPTGPSQFRIIYSQIEWNAALPICDYTLNPLLGTNCIGNIAGVPDRYRIRRSNTGWSGAVTWQYGTLGSTSAIGDNNDCACSELPEVKQLSTQGLTLHVLEIFYSYVPNRVTALHRFLGPSTLDNFYKRSVFMDRL